MRFISWNVNGLRAVQKKGFEDIVSAFGADVIALQETKLQAGQTTVDLPDYYEYWTYAERKGYSGTAVFSRQQPLQVLHGLGSEYLDTEGRITALEFPDFWFVNVYTPNSQDQLARIAHRMEWDDAFRDFCKGLEEGALPGGVPFEKPAPGEGHPDIADLPKTEPGATADPKPVVMCGDFNVAHQEIDLKNPATNIGNPGFSEEERTDFQKLIDAGFVDTFRYLHPDLEGAYTWWSYRFNARKNNAGWRIDYFLVSEILADKITSACMYDEVMGSDHCPVGLELELE